jgi:endonuclease/exonuclease/phosphatase family metal-dependent hydrolase
MNPTDIASRIFRTAAAALSAAALLSGCASRHAAVPATNTPTPIVIDGDTREWAANVAATSDEHYVYLRFSVADAQFTLQSSPRSVAIYIDADADAATGFAVKPGAGEKIGADMLVLFSPDSKPGVAIYSLSDSGARTALSIADFDFVFAPTYAASWYEARICRTPQSPGALPKSGLLSPGHLKGFAAILDENGAISASSQQFSIETQEVCVGGRRYTADDLPVKPKDAIRIVSWNIEQSKPVDHPEPFARILNVVNPDVLLLQEWERGDSVAVQTWLTTNLGGQWFVAKAPGDMTNGGGVLVASRFELTPAAHPPVTCSFKTDKGQDDTKPVRFVAATLNTPAGPLVAASVHLKSRGTKDSIEDRRRIAECRAVNKAMSEIIAAGHPKLRVISGDLNLVGSRPPLDILRAGLDTDGSDLSPAPAPVFGDLAFYTWRDPSTPFSAGRLDWLNFSDASADCCDSFVLDTSRFDDSILTKYKLLRADSEVSDHLPVIVDIRAR